MQKKENTFPWEGMVGAKKALALFHGTVERAFFA
jgi:hypothetical protein